jgi:hypothetical protein
VYINIGELRSCVAAKHPLRQAIVGMGWHSYSLSYAHCHVRADATL